LLAWFAKSSAETKNGTVLGRVGLKYDPRFDTARRLWRAQTRVRVERTYITDPTGSYGTNPTVRCSLFKPEMRAVLMMVTNILGEQSFQMAFIQRNNVVQQVSSAASYPPSRCYSARESGMKFAWE
jgi:hypothetical protein